MMPILSDVPDGLVDGGRSLQWGGEGLSGFMANCVHAKKKDYLWNLDKLATYTDEDQRREMLRKIEEARKRGKL
jgi:hypothetical protein